MAMIYTDDQQGYDSPGIPQSVYQPPAQSPTYSGWQDPYRPPNQGDPYYDAWVEGTKQTGLPAGTGTQLNANNTPRTSGASGGWDEAFIRKNLAETGQDPNTFGYWLGKYDELTAREKELNQPGYALNRLRNPNSGGSAGPSYNSNSVFDDPATAGWLSLLNSRVNALNTPYQNPQLDQLNSYLQSYFQKLQGPAYTPQQMDLLQTQSLDPLTRERDSALQRERERASARGLGRDSGIAQSRSNDIERQFEQLRTQTQAGFASKAVDLDRINAQQAAGVAQLLANIEQTSFNQNEQRANQALDIARQVPDLARQRMLDANGVVSQSSLNPTSLLGLSMQSDQADAARNQQFWLGLANLVPGLLGLFKNK